MATGAGLILVLIHLLLVPHWLREGFLLLSALVIGLVVDAFHIHSGVLLFPLGSIHPDLPPPWILVLWLQFATTLHYSLAWLDGRNLAGIILGAVAGPLAYWAGVRFGAASFGLDLYRCLLQIGLSWGVVMVLLLRIASLTKTGKVPVYRPFVH